MLVLDGVTKRFRRTEVLKGISLNINKGERIALVGSNGAGKTTLIRCLLGEYTHGGKISIGGMEPRLQREDVLSHVGFVPQLPPPLRMPVDQLIKFSASVCNSQPQRIVDVATRLGLNVEQIASRPFVKLSGGQKQKLLISIALGRDTSLLIMDEPAANLDPEARHVFFNLLAERRDESVMIISSHRLDEVASLVNRVVEMDYGAITLDDRVADSLDMAAKLNCRVRISRAEPAFAKAMESWNFVIGEDGISWQGSVAAPDRLRFLGMISRYAGLLSGLTMDEVA